MGNQKKNKKIEKKSKTWNLVAKHHPTNKSIQVGDSLLDVPQYSKYSSVLQRLTGFLVFLFQTICLKIFTAFYSRLPLNSKNDTEVLKIVDLESRVTALEKALQVNPHHTNNSISAPSLTTLPPSSSPPAPPPPPPPPPPLMIMICSY